MPQKSWPKPVIITTRFGPNYLWHMLAVAKIGYDSEYADKYRETVNPDDFQYLESNKSLLEFEGSEGGELAGFFAGLPGWLHIETKQDFTKYFKALDISLRDGNLDPIVDAFNDVDWSDRFFGKHLRHTEFPEERTGIIEQADRLGQIYLRNMETYQREVWPIAQEALTNRANELNDYFGRQDYIAKWEEMLGIPFEAKSYEIALCYANKNGPDYNSLGYSGNLFYYDKPFLKTCQFLSHEIGTHLLIDLYFDLANNQRYDHKKLYSAYETMAMFYNKLILGVNQLEYSIPQMNDKWHISVYEGAYYDGIDPKALLLKALES
jgi:hypothetical protein